MDRLFLFSQNKKKEDPQVFVYSEMGNEAINTTMNFFWFIVSYRGKIFKHLKKTVGKISTFHIA